MEHISAASSPSRYFLSLSDVEGAEIVRVGAAVLVLGKHCYVANVFDDAIP